MKMPTYTNKQISEGKKLLKSLKIKARKDAEKILYDTSSSFMPSTVLGQRTLENIKEKNIEAIVVYNNQQNEWFADILLKNTPVGIPNVLGTPVNSPEKTEKEALKSAYTILVNLYKEILLNEKTKSDLRTPNKDRVFILYGNSLNIPGEVIEKFHEFLNNAGIEKLFSREELRQQLHKKIKEIQTEEEFNPDDFDRSTKEKREEIISIIIQLLLQGDFKYPERMS
jgi:hypothetical protein